MLRWREFKTAAPKIASIGEKLLFNPDSGKVAILASIDAKNQPWTAPFCPIFAGEGMYILSAANTPKTSHLTRNSQYALHAMLGEDDLEFQVSGAARSVLNTTERSLVLNAIPFPNYDPNDPIFELLIARALTVTWPKPGKCNKLTWKL